MSVEENKTLVRRFQEGLWHAGNVALIDELVAPNVALGGVSPEQWKANVLDFRKRIPDLTFTIEETIAEGDKVVIRWTMRGTHTSELLTPLGPVPPTGKPFTVTGITIHRVQGGQIIEDRFENNLFEWLQQLGAIPAPSQSTS